MIVNNNKCCQCGEQKKEKELLIFSVNNCKFSQCKDCFQKNLSSKSKTVPESSQENKENPNKSNIFVKNESKKLDSKEPFKNINEVNLLKKKKRRISKKILFKHKIEELNIDEFCNIIYNIINEAAETFKLIFNPQTNKKNSKLNCNLCKQTKLNKENKNIRINSFTEFKDFFNYIFNRIENEDNKQKLSNISLIKYNQIIENKKDMPNINIKMNEPEKELLNKKYCFSCIYDSLIKNNGIILLSENILPEENSPLSNKKQLEIISGLEDMLINANRNNDIRNFSESKTNEENNNSNKADKNSSNSSNNNENFFFDDKKVNIFDLILGDEDDDTNNINDLENNSEENKSIKNIINIETKKINDNKKDKKSKIKTKENKITFMKTEIFNNNELNKTDLKNNSNNKNTFEINDKNKNINIINMNNINNINQFNDQKYIKKNNDQFQPLLFNMNFNTNNNFLSQNKINNNGLGYLNNNNFINGNEELIFDRLNTQLSFLKNNISLMSNLNNTRINNSPLITNNNDLPILISKSNLKENLFYFKNSMNTILNYMNNISEMLEKYSCINEHSLNLIDSMLNGTIGTDSILLLKNNHNHLSQLLNYNYNIQRMNAELCDIINEHLNY